MPVIVGSASLALSITPDVYNTAPNGQVTYTLSYNNPSTVTISNVTLNAVIPANTSSATTSWVLPALNPGDSGTKSLVLDVGAGYISNSLTLPATIAGTDPASTPVSATAQSTIYINVPLTNVAAFTFEKTASAVQIDPTGTVTYTLSYKNYGDVSATNVIITDALAAGMLYSSSSPVASSAPAVGANGAVSWNLGTVAAGATNSVTVTTTASDPFTFPNPANNTASINWTDGTAVQANVDVGVTGEFCSATFYFRQGVDNVLSTIRPASQTAPTDTFDYITTLSNINDNAFETYDVETNQVVFEQDLGLASDLDISGKTLTISYYLSAVQGGGRTQAILRNDTTNTEIATSAEFSISTGATTLYTFTAAIPANTIISAGDKLRWYFQFRASGGKDITFHYDSDIYNSRSSFCSASGPANLSINKTVDLSTVPESTVSTVVYSIDYYNTGSTDATNAVIVDTLPAGVSFTSAKLNTFDITPTGTNPYTFAVGTVTAATSGVLEVTAEVSNTATGLLTNTALLSSDLTTTVTDTTDTLVGAPNTETGVTTAPELYMDKTSNVSLLSASETVTYTLTVVNAGSADATNVVVTDDFPDQSYFNYVSCTTADGTCSEAPAGTLNWNVGTLAAGVSASLTYQMQTTATGLPNGLTALNNTAVATDDDYCTGGTPPASCSSDMNTVNASGNPDLSLVLIANTTTVIPGDVIQYTAVITNNGSSTATDLVTSNPVPDNTSFVDITTGTGSFDTINNRLLFPLSSLAAGASTTYIFNVKVSSPLPSGSTSLTDTATVTASNAASANDTVVITANAAPVMSLSLTGPDSVPLPATTLTADVNSSTTLNVASAALLQPGDYIRVGADYVIITSIAGDVVTINVPISASNGAVIELAAKFSIAYQNTGNAAATNVQISELLPAGWLYVASSPAATSAPALGQNGSISWTLGTIDAGASGSMQFVALPTTSGTFTHTAILSADGIVDVAANHIVLVGGLIVDKIATSDTTEPGAQATYTITINNSLSSDVNGVTVKDLLAAGFTFASSTTTPSSFEGGDQSRPIWTVNVPANSSVSITFTVDISADLGAATYQNEVEVTAPGGIGVINFDALATTAEDVTLLLGTGLISGYVNYGNSPMVGVEVNFYENSVLAYSVYTDNSGRYQQVLEAGTNWRIEIASDTDNDVLLSGLSLTSGIDPEDFSIVSGASINRNFVYSLAAPTVVSQTTTDQTPTITGTYPSNRIGGVLTVAVNGVTYSVGANLSTLGDNWTLTIPLIDLLPEATYSVTAIITDDQNSRTDLTNSELVIDLTAPIIPTVNSQTTSSGTPTITGTYPSADAAGGFSVTVNGVTYVLGVDVTLTVNGDNWSLVIPAGNALPDNTYSVTATVTDGAGNSRDDATNSELIVTAGTNAPPVAVDDTAFSAIDSSVIISVLNNDSDPENTALTVTAVSTAANGVVVINADNTITYTPAAGFSGTDSFTYTITDADGLTDTATVNITIVAAPTITLPADIFIDATGLFTKVDLGTATAVDYLGNPVPVSVIDGITFYWSGDNEAIWQATDANGLTSTATQAVRVRPLVSFSKDQTVAEGSQVIVKVVLNGPSPIYPVNVSYAVTGSAINPDDHNLNSGIAVINSGTETTIVIDITDDGLGEGDETIILSMDDPALNQGVKNSHTITISEDNIAPSVSLNVVQNSSNRLTVAKNEGQVLITTTVSDPNLTDTHSYDWSLSNALLVDLDNDVTTFTFDPTNLDEGVYEVRADVTDDGVPPESNVARAFINVVASLPGLTAADSDGDGIADNIEGFSDADRDGIPDYLDSVMECNVIPEQGLTFNGYLVEGDPGVCIRVGNYSVVGESGGAQITDNDINLSPSDDLTPDPDADNVGGIFDFIATEVPDNSQSVNIVIPQRLAVPANAIYRKLSNGVWFTFIEDSKNKVASTLGEPGFCPPPGSAGFQPGLTEGHWCVQITIEDGGPNDADGLINRMIVDPGGVGVLRSVTETFFTAGGGVINLWGLLMMVFIMMGRVLRKPQQVLLAIMLTISAVVSHAETNNQPAEVVVSETTSTPEINSDTDKKVAEAPAEGGTTAPIDSENSVENNDNKVVVSPAVEAAPVVNVIERKEVVVKQEGSRIADMSSAINTTPVAVNDEASTEQNTQLMIPVLSNDVDADGDKLKVILATAQHGTVTVDDESRLHYTPNKDFIGSDSISYVVYDGRGNIPSELEAQGVDIKALCGADGCIDSKQEKVTFQLQVNFANNDDTVEEKYFKELEKLVGLMQAAKDENVIIEGHTSAVGSARYNQKLSERRAKSIVDELLSRFKIDPARVKAIGYGESQLINKENTDAAHAENRRIVAVFDSSFIKKINRISGVSKASVQVSVINSNNGPVALDDAAETDQNKNVVINVLVNDSDIDGDKLSTIKATPNHGEVIINEEGQLVYSPKHNFFGMDKIQYQIEDEKGAQAEAMVCIFIHKKSPWYGWFDTGIANGTASINQLNTELTDAGISATVTGMDDTRNGAQFGIGYELNDSGWRFEFGYADLGEVELSLSATAPNLSQLYSDIANVHPLSAKGYLFAAQYQWSFSAVEVLARVGYWSWDASYETYSSSLIGNDNLTGSDLIAGFGAQINLTKRLAARALYQRFAVDSEDTDFISMGLVFSM